MPQICWFELQVNISCNFVIGPKDFPIVLKKIGTWIDLLKDIFLTFKKCK